MSKPFWQVMIENRKISLKDKRTELLNDCSVAKKLGFDVVSKINCDKISLIDDQLIFLDDLLGQLIKENQ